MNGERVTMLIPLVSDLAITTTGGGAGSETKIVLDLPEITRIFPRVEKARVQWAVEGANTNLLMQVKGRWSVRGKDWSASPFNLSEVFTTSTDAPQKVDATWQSDDTKHAAHVRAELWAWNGAQVGTQISGRVWAWLEVRFLR